MKGGVVRKPGNGKNVPGDLGTFLAAGLAGHPAFHHASSSGSDGTHSQKYSLIFLFMQMCSRGR
jgi:hypothetical protein